MSNYDINSNPSLVKRMIEQYKAHEEQMKMNPDSILLNFKQELLNLGFNFQVLNQAESLLPKYKDTVLPVVIKYYKMAKLKNEKQYLLGWFHHKGLEEVVPMLLEDYYSNNPEIDKWAIGDRLYQIRSKKYIDDYLKIISDPSYGQDRQMIVLLLGKLKEESAIPILIDLLEDEEVRLQAICALGQFKREEFRCYFERFQNSTHSGWRKYAKTALKKLNS
ncbi:MAG: HEAT repeat domain-containing protein [Eubacterium sp.]|nr:HEAT repeat domain-containing protein [Eubacterium sp.]